MEKPAEKPLCWCTPVDGKGKEKKEKLGVFFGEKACA
jgi:hypothetical protein